ncbi:MAG TPA: hypothetical protein EYG68_01585 [Leucothrix mucor]|nr:hypothetical protein [Leucothrix mucor]
MSEIFPITTFLLSQSTFATLLPTSLHDTFSVPLMVSISPREKTYPRKEPLVAEIYQRNLLSTVLPLAV